MRTLTDKQLSILGVLHAMGEYLGPGEIARRLGHTDSFAHAWAIKALESLEKNGLVRKYSDRPVIYVITLLGSEEFVRSRLG